MMISLIEKYPKRYIIKEMQRFNMNFIKTFLLRRSINVGMCIKKTNDIVIFHLKDLSSTLAHNELN